MARARGHIVHRHHAAHRHTRGHIVHHHNKMSATTKEKIASAERGKHHRHTVKVKTSHS